MSKLTFDALRAANTARLPLFKNKRGEPAHTEPDGSDWSPCSWSNAVCGEAGELANEIKKLRRGDYTREEAIPKIAGELADIICYADLLAKQFGIDLGTAVTQKFNEVSMRVGAPIAIDASTGLVVGFAVNTRKGNEL